MIKMSQNPHGKSNSETGITQAQLDELIQKELSGVKEEAEKRKAKYLKIVDRLGNVNDLKGQLESTEDAITEIENTGKKAYDEQREYLTLRREYLHAGGREDSFDVVYNAIKDAESAAAFLEDNPYLKESDELPEDVMQVIDEVTSNVGIEYEMLARKVDIAAAIVEERNKLRNALAAYDKEDDGKAQYEEKKKYLQTRREYVHAGGDIELFDSAYEDMRDVESIEAFMADKPYLKEPDRLPEDVMKAIDEMTVRNEEKTREYVQKISIAADILDERERLRRTLNSYENIIAQEQEQGERKYKEAYIKRALHQAYLKHKGIERAADVMIDSLYAQGKFDIDEKGEITVTINLPMYHDGEMPNEEKKYNIKDYIIARTPLFAIKATGTRGSGSPPGISSDGFSRDESEGIRPGESDKVFARKKGVWTDHDPPPETE